MAAADYFLRNRVIGWFALKVIGIIPVYRGVHQANPLQACIDALAAKKIVIIFPKARGEPGKFLRSIRHLASEPAMPGGADYPRLYARAGPLNGQRSENSRAVFIDIFIDEPLFYDADKATFKQSLFTRFVTLQKQATRKIT